MIYLDSRYSDSTLYKAFDARTGTYQVTVQRVFPEFAIDYFIHEWVETDRLDNLALRHLGDPSLWWRIMDINPEVIDPSNISPGTQLRIPND